MRLQEAGFTSGAPKPVPIVQSFHFLQDVNGRKAALDIPAMSRCVPPELCPAMSALMICFCSAAAETVVRAMLIDDGPPARCPLGHSLYGAINHPPLALF